MGQESYIEFRTLNCFTYYWHEGASSREGWVNASVEAVPTSEQAEQAKLMRSFTSKFKPGDAFKVEVVN